MKERRFHIVIASVVFALTMWVSINLGYEYTVTRQVPVVLENLKQGTALRYPVPRFVTVRFRGIGWQLAALYLSPDVRYFIDVSTLSERGFTLTEDDLSEHVKLPVRVQALDVRPESLTLALDDYREKRLPVVPQVSIQCLENYGQVGPVKTVPETVVAGGARSIVDGLASWRTVYRRYDNRRTPVDEEIPLEDIQSHALEVYPRAVRIQADVQPFAERTFTGVSLAATSTPPGREVIFVPPKMDITIRGGIDQMARLSAEDFRPTVEYGELLQDTLGVVEPNLSVPENVRVIRRSPERFSFLIRKRL